MTQRELEEYLIDQQTSLYRLAYSCLRSREDALDAVQETFLRLWKYRAEYRPTA